MEKLRQKTRNILRKSESIFKTDMVYFAKSNFWLNGGQLAIAFIGFFSSIVFANLVPLDVYGTYKYILSVGGLLGVLTLSGLDTAVTRAVAKGYEGEFVKGVLLNLKWEIILFLASVVGATYYYTHGNTALALGLIIVGIFSPIIDSTGLYGAFLGGRKDFKTASILNVIRYGIAAIWITITVLITRNPIVLVLSYFFIHTVIVTIMFFIVVKTKKPNHKTDEETLKLIKHSSFINNYSALFDQVDNLLVFHFLGPISLAIYNFTQIVPDQLAGLIKNIGPIALPKFAQGKREEIFKTIKHKSFQIFLVGLGMTVIYVLLAPPFFHIFFPKYSTAIAYSQVYSLILLFSAVLPLAFIDSRVAIKERYWINTLSILFETPATFIGIYYWGLWGLIIVRVLAKAFGVFVGYYFALTMKSE